MKQKQHPKKWPLRTKPKIAIIPTTQNSHHSRANQKQVRQNGHLPISGWNRYGIQEKKAGKIPVYSKSTKIQVKDAPKWPKGHPGQLKTKLQSISGLKSPSQSNTLSPHSWQTSKKGGKGLGSGAQSPLDRRWGNILPLNTHYRAPGKGHYNTSTKRRQKQAKVFAAKNIMPPPTHCPKGHQTADQCDR